MTSSENPENLPSLVEQLTKRRRRMIWSLSAVLSLILVLCIYLMTIGSQFAAQPIAIGSSVTIAIMFGGSVVIIGSAITAFYVVWANRNIDPLIKQANLMRQKQSK